MQARIPNTLNTLPSGEAPKPSTDTSKPVLPSARLGSTAMVLAAATGDKQCVFWQQRWGRQCVLREGGWLSRPQSMRDCNLLLFRSLSGETRVRLW